MTETEVWRPVVGFEGLYEVSNLGRVRSLNFNHTGKTVIRKLDYSKKYPSVWLAGNKNFSVHRLVALAFLPNPDNLPQVNHKDENRNNNFVYVNEDGTVVPELSNLEWCTAEYNQHYGKMPEIRQRLHKKCCKPVTVGGITFASQKEASDYFNVSPATICLMKQGKIVKSRKVPQIT